MSFFAARALGGLRRRCPGEAADHRKPFERKLAADFLGHITAINGGESRTDDGNADFIESEGSLHVEERG